MAATNKDIDKMVGRMDPELSVTEVEWLQELLANNCNVFALALHAPGQAWHKAHHIKVGVIAPLRWRHTVPHPRSWLSRRRRLTRC